MGATVPGSCPTGRKAHAGTSGPHLWVVFVLGCCICTGLCFTQYYTLLTLDLAMPNEGLGNIILVTLDWGKDMHNVCFGEVLVTSGGSSS